MGKIHVNHRIVIRGQGGEIISDTQYTSFAEAEPVYQAAVEALHPGQHVALQHGARIAMQESG